jgi:hypothetical protein
MLHPEHFDGFVTFLGTHGWYRDCVSLLEGADSAQARALEIAEWVAVSGDVGLLPTL